MAIPVRTLRLTIALLILGFTSQGDADTVRKPETPINARPKEKEKPKCARVIASKTNARDLRLIGVIQHGTKKKVLLLDLAGRGHIVAPGECAGCEQVPFYDWFPVGPIALKPLLAH